jgi:hypothetical protein
MPFIDATKRLQALYAFVDQFAAGDNALRSSFDQVIGDLVSSTNQLAAYLESIVLSGADPRILGPKATTPTTRNDASPLQAGDFYISTNAAAGRVGLMYRFDGSVFRVVSDFGTVSALGTSLVGASNPAAARGLLELGSAAQQPSTAFAAASVAADVALALKLADANGLAETLTDWNAAHLTGPGTAFVQANAAALNGPEAINLSGVYVAYDINNGFLIASDHQNGRVYLRLRVSETWGTWRRIFSVENASLADGDMFYMASGALTRLAKGAASTQMFMDAAGLFPLWRATPLIGAKANFGAQSLSGTYSRTGNLVTVTMTAHGMLTGQFASLDFTTGGATDGWYQVTVIDANSFTVVDSASGTTSGNVTRLIWMRAGTNIASIVRNSTGDYTINLTTAMADVFYSIAGVAATISGNVGVLSSRIGPVDFDKTTTSFRVISINQGGAPFDCPSVNVIIS